MDDRRWEAWRAESKVVSYITAWAGRTFAAIWEVFAVMNEFRSRDQLARRPEDPAPPDWEARWNEPLTWPAPPEDAAKGVQAQLEAHRRNVPGLERAALVLVDVDKKAFDRNIERFGVSDPAVGRELTERIYAVALPNMIRLSDFFRARGRPVVFVQWAWHRYPYPPLAPRRGDEIVVKRSRGAFGASSLDALLRGLRVETCFFAGADTAFCVASTVRGAIDHGYTSVLVEDACVCCLRRLHEATVETLGYMQAHVLTTDQVVALPAPAP